MGEYTKVAYASLETTRLFGRQLGALARELKRIMPMFRGRMIPTSTPGVERWEIQTIIPGEPTSAENANWYRTNVYPDWAGGVRSAMHDALSRMCHAFRDDLHPDSVFRLFGKRDDEGQNVNMEDDGI